MARLILLACQPKSGSTFLSRYLSEVGGGKPYSYVPGWGRREQELCAFRLLRGKFKMHRFLVGQHHVRCSAETIKLIGKFNISVIVLYRNIFDAIASLRDHLRKEDHVGPMIYLDREMLQLSDNELEVALARFAVPWYLNFYMSWREYRNAMFIEYEQIRVDPVKTVEKILEDFRLSPLNGGVNIDEVKRSSRFNAGVSGRGKLISAEAQDIIRDQVKFYLRFLDDNYLRQHIE